MASWLDLIKLMYGGQTPEVNAAHGFSTEAANPAYDLTDKPNIVDASGNVVTDPALQKMYKSQGGQNLYKPITGLTAAMNPQAAMYSAEQNANFQLAPTIAQHQNEIANQVAAGNVEQVRGVYGKSVSDPAMSNTQLAILANRDPSATSLYNVNNLAAEQQAGLPESNASLKSAANAANQQIARNALAHANRDALRLPSSEAMYDQDTVNKLSKAVNVDPLEIQNTANELSGNIKRNPTTQEIADTIARTHSTEANMAEGMAKEKERYMPYYKAIMGNEAISGAYSSNYTPSPSAPFGMKIDREVGTVTPGLIPGYRNMLEQMSAKLPSGSATPTVNGLTVRGPNGTALPMVTQRFDAMTGKPLLPPTSSNTHTPVIGTSGSGSPAVPTLSSITGQHKPVAIGDVGEFNKWLQEQKLEQEKSALRESGYDPDLVRKSLGLPSGMFR